ncbi:MAG: phosphohistidine phosphatase SixA [Kangiellaceae bacterium]|jgi:phosphohistidine phosphatase|nr:phosphohistidine phosphatase SixA [Kangiellaceae bacterium]
MKKLWIMRHAEAIWQSTSDNERTLTEKGFQQVESVYQKVEDFAPKDVWVSPLIRTQQTFQTLCKYHDFSSSNITTEPMITPEADIAMVIELIEHSEFNELLMVSHMPTVAELTRQLTGDNRIGGFYPAQIVCCTMAEDHWSLDTIYTPDIL